ncbi:MULTISPECIES: VanZ family protein [unclassified Arthrobacter]|uniref:VanZ family protein n=1 Tax=unclassified Arthrobacter TaxID=235627 RepID=UPI0015E48685|nr:MULTISPECIES: VanZ family protein [unclassified Arthrobacter]
MHEQHPEPGLARASKRMVPLFAIYLVLLGWMVLWKLEIPFVGSGSLRLIKLVPFVAWAESGSSAPVEVGLNLVLFMPFGLYLGLLARAWHWLHAVGLMAGVSLAFEIIQYVLALGSSDATDVIVNTLGGLTGYVFAARLARSARPRIWWKISVLCTVLTVILVLLTALFILSPVRYAPLGAEPGSSTTSTDYPQPRILPSVANRAVASHETAAPATATWLSPRRAHDHWLPRRPVIRV